MRTWTGLICLRRNGGAFRHRAGLVALAVLFTTWTPLGGALAAAPVPAPAGVGVERFVIDSAASQALYHVGETFFNRNNQFKVAVGTTHGIQGQILVDRAHPSQSRIGPITVDISQLASDSRHRDREIQNRWLESARYPTAVFTPTSIDGLPGAYVDGRAIPIRIAGSLEVHGVTKPVTFSGTVTLNGQTLTGDATTSVLMTDFGFDPPSLLGVLQAQNQAELEIQFTAQRAP
ncbi:MAG TPA: YceI family protein [bacterium]|nr:YceI family protein [bacterium]